MEDVPKKIRIKVMDAIKILRQPYRKEQQRIAEKKVGYTQYELTKLLNEKKWTIIRGKKFCKTKR
jgi:hypothetical protein